MASNLNPSFASPGSHKSKNRSFVLKFDPHMSILPPPPPPTSSPLRGSSMDPLDKEKASRNFNFMIDTFFSIDQRTTDEFILKFLMGINALRKEVSYLPMTLVLHGTQDYVKPDDAYRMAEEATSRFTAAIHLITGRLNILQPEESMDPVELKPEEQNRLSQILECGEKGTLHGCLQALYSDFKRLVNRFSPPSNDELPKSLSNALKGGWGLSLETCPAWLTSNPPWVLVPSSLYVLYLSKESDIPFPKMLVEWIMCILIETSNMSRRNSISPRHRMVIKKAVYLLEDTFEDAMAESTHNSYDSISHDLYIKFREILEKDESTRDDCLDYKENELSIIDKKMLSVYSYNLLKELIPSQSSSTSTSPAMPSKRNRLEATRLEHESLLGDLAWSKPKGEILDHTTATWIQNYIADHTKNGKPSSSHKKPTPCNTLLNSLIPKAIQGITMDRVIQNEMEEEVRKFLTKRTLHRHAKFTHPFDKNDPPLSKASNWAYRSYMNSWKFGIKPATGVPPCIRDFFMLSINPIYPIGS